MSYMDTLRYYEAKGLVSLRPHPVYDLFVCNYTKMAQYSQSWDEVTLNNRGRVVDSNGITVSPCLPKFFNYQEHEVHDWLDPVPAAEDFVVYEKLDGSYISVTNSPKYPDLIIASRGSFESDQAKWAAEILKERNLTVPEGYTYIFELIHPENRIVVDYGGDRALIVLTRFYDGEEIPLHVKSDDEKYLCQFPWPLKVAVYNVEGLLKSEEENFEGYVIQFESGLRVKVKLDEYVRLHKIVTGLTPKKVLEAAKTNTSHELIEVLPDEYFDWVKHLLNLIYDRFNTVYVDGLELSSMARAHAEDRKGQAQYILSHERKDVASIAFKALDGKDLTDAVWKYVEKEFPTWDLDWIRKVPEDA